MNAKELKHLSRKQLLELLIETKKENVDLRSQIEATKIVFPDERYEELLETTRSLVKTYLLEIANMQKELLHKQSSGKTDETKN